MNIKNNKNCKITINDKTISLKKSADEMFEELGYKKRVHINFKTEQIDIIAYDKSENEIRIEDCSLIFLIFPRMITTNVIINMQELQAINKKCEELGWI